MRLALFAAAAGLALIAAPVAGEPIRLDADSRDALRVTVYQGGLALIEDARTATLGAGPGRLAFEGVSPGMVPESVVVDAGGRAVDEVAYDFDLLTPAALLRAAIGREVGVVRTHPTTGEDSVERATVLAAEGGVVLRYRDRIETGVPGRLVFDDVPPGLRPVPTLVAALAAGTAGPRPVTLRYLTGGLDWNADYAATWDEAAGTLDLVGRAMLTNTTGIGVVDARLALVAGDVRRVSAPKARPGALAMRAMAADEAQAAPPQRQAIGDFHLYSIGRPLTLGDRETKQLALLAAAGVPVTRTYESRAQASVFGLDRRPSRPTNPEVRLAFDNGDAGPGVPLPAGVLRLFARDASGTARLVGEDRVPATPVGGRVEVSPGRAFDIRVTRTQTDFVRAGLAEKTHESAHRIEVQNGKDVPVTVRVVEHIPGDWRIVDESAPHAREAADRAVWPIEVAAGETATLVYRVVVRR